jgi:hypothetical protein
LIHIRKKAVTVALLALTAIAAGAKSDAPTFSHGTIQSSCAPWDGPAIEMRLTTEPAECKKVSGPFLSIAIWRGLPVHAGQVVNLNEGSGAGSIARCAKEGDCKLTQSAIITFDKYQERASAAGHYELQLKGGEILKGTFEVKWCEDRVICG